MKLISIILFLSFALSSGPRLLQAAPAAAPQNQRISMTVGHSFVIDTKGDLERVAVATEDVIEAVAVTQREVVLNAKSVGETSVIIWQRNNGGRQSYDVTVEPSSSKADALRRNLRKDVGEAVEGELNDKTVLLRGSVRSQAEGDKAMAIAAAFGIPVNLMTVATPPAAAQILLKVRFADVDRSASLSLGANLFSTGAGNTIGGVTTQQFSPPSTGSVGGSGSSSFNLSNALNLFLYRPELNLGATIEALAAKGLVQILAEPNVLATDGKQASFLAGGEFPYPVVQSSVNGASNVTILFREFGIRLNFTPTITARGTIKLEVAPEVSSLDYANGLIYQGFNIPGLDVRRIKTEIELENNQSFAIAGLLDNRVTQNLSKVPGLGDIPFFGKLFQSESISRSNSELLVVVTPELVQPIPAGAPQPGPVMPKPFLKEGSTTPTMANPPDTRPISAVPEVPFEPSEKKPAALPNGAAALPDAASAFTNSLKGK